MDLVSVFDTFWSRFVRSGVSCFWVRGLQSVPSQQITLALPLQLLGAQSGSQGFHILAGQGGKHPCGLTRSVLATKPGLDKNLHPKATPK